MLPYRIIWLTINISFLSSKLCPNEIIDLSDRISEFRNINTEIVACSVDSYLTHQVWSKMSRSDGGVAYPKIPLLSDYTHEISKSYGCYLPQAGHTLRYVCSTAWCWNFWNIINIVVLQSALHHRYQRNTETYYRKWYSSHSRCQWDIETCSSFPKCWRKWEKCCK